MQPLADGVDADALQGVRKRASCVREVQVIIDLIEGFLAGLAVLEFEGAKPRFDLGGRRDRLWDRLGPCAGSEQQAGNHSAALCDAGERFH
ncbi:hypothetical protein D3C87_1602890 [compost metagenome]